MITKKEWDQAMTAAHWLTISERRERVNSEEEQQTIDNALIVAQYLKEADQIIKALVKHIADHHKHGKSCKNKLLKSVKKIWGLDKQGFCKEKGGLSFSYKNVRQCFRWIEPGTFIMGSSEEESESDEEEISPDDDISCYELQHEVTLTKRFLLGETTCTQALWEAVMGDNPSDFQGEKRPVENVTWHTCVEFINKLNKAVGLDFRLPTEAEWEYACRAGTQTPFSFGDNATTEQVNYDGDYPYEDFESGITRDETVDVKSLPPNAWGLYEMHGNVGEFCFSVDESSCVVRGGSWDSFAWHVRSASHDLGWSNYPYRHELNNTGFRLAHSQIFGNNDIEC